MECTKPTQGENHLLKLYHVTNDSIQLTDNWMNCLSTTKKKKQTCDYKENKIGRLLTKVYSNWYKLVTQRKDFFYLIS